MSERDQNGRFAKGNGGGPGRPKKAREEKYLDILVSACTPDEWEQVCRVAIARAKAGDSRAREWLANYIIGKAIERHEITGPEGGPLAIDTGIDASDITEALAILGGANGCPGCGS